MCSFCTNSQNACAQTLGFARRFRTGPTRLDNYRTRAKPRCAERPAEDLPEESCLDFVWQRNVA